MEHIVRSICGQEGIPCRQVEAMGGGQVNHVFLVDGAYVVRIGAREDAGQRLEREAGLLRRLEGSVPVPRVLASGEQDGLAYQVQERLRGQNLYTVWRDLSPAQQEGIAAQMAEYLDAIHAVSFDHFGYGRPGGPVYTDFAEFLNDKFQRTLDEIQALQIRMLPGIVELAQAYFSERLPILRGGAPVLVHSDLTMTNILAEGGKITGLLDFEHAMQAPADYELWAMEAFCLYPNDYAEEHLEVFCAADFASFIPLVRGRRPACFDVPRLRERVDLYQVDAALGSYLAWRKANLATIPPERMAAKEFYLGRVSNFLFAHGARMFFG